MVRNHSLVVALAFILNATNADAQKALGQPFDLGVGKSVLIIDAGIRVGFDHTVSDSRCANGVVCVWEGNATARIWGEQSPGGPADVGGDQSALPVIAFARQPA